MNAVRDLRRFLQGGRGPEAPGGDGPAETAGSGHGERGTTPGPAPGKGPRAPGGEVPAGAAGTGHRTGNSLGTRPGSGTGVPGGEELAGQGTGTGTRNGPALPSRADHCGPRSAGAAASGQRHRHPHRDPLRALWVLVSGHSSARAPVTAPAPGSAPAPPAPGRWETNRPTSNRKQPSRTKPSRAQPNGANQIAAVAGSRESSFYSGPGRVGVTLAATEAATPVSRRRLLREPGTEPGASVGSRDSPSSPRFQETRGRAGPGSDPVAAHRPGAVAAAASDVENPRRDADRHPGHGCTPPAGSRSRSRSLSRSIPRSVPAPPLPAAPTLLSRLTGLPITRLTSLPRPLGPCVPQ